MLRHPRRGREELTGFQSERVRHIIRCAYEQVPFYRERFRQAGVHPKDVHSVNDLSRLPLTAKSDLRNVPLSDRLARGARPGSLRQYKTSGSTGEPFTIYRTVAEDNFIHLFRMRALRQFGLRLRDRTVTIIGAPIGSGQSDTLRRTIRALGWIPRDFIDCTDADESILARLAELRPDLISGYPGALAHLAPLIASRPDLGVKPRFAYCGGEPLTARMRDRIESSLRLPLFELYGAHECNLIAWQCPEHRRLHVCDDNVVVEILKDGRPASEGERGEVYLTALFSETMPFIRYRLGDIAARGPTPCPCGQPFSTIEGIQGRSVEYLTLKDGRSVHPYAITTPLIDREDEWIEQHQLVQESLDRVVLRVRPRRPPLPFELQRLREAGKSATGPGLAFEVALVDRFPRDPSGKFRSYLGLQERPTSSESELKSL